MKRYLKVMLYYFISFIIFLALLCFIDFNNGLLKNASTFSIVLNSILKTITSDVRIVTFLALSSIPLVIYLTGKYIEKINNETDEFILDYELSEDEINENKEKYKVTLTREQRNYLELGNLNNSSGIYSGIVVDNHKYKELYVNIKNTNLSNTLIIEQSENDVKFNARTIKGLISDEESLVIFDEEGIIKDYSQDMLSINNYDVRILDLQNNMEEKSEEYSNTINLLRYINEKEEISEVANIIAKSDKYRAKLLETLIYIVKEDNKIIEKTFKEVFNLTTYEISQIELKAKNITEAYKAYNELILLNEKEKTAVLKDIKHALKQYTQANINSEEKGFSLDMLKQGKEALFIIIPTVCVGNTLYNVLLSTIEYANKNRQVGSRKGIKNTYILLPNLNKFDYMIGIVERMLLSNRNKIFYICSISNMKEFKNKYVKDSKRLFDVCDIKIFNGFRQYETIALLKNVLMIDEEVAKSVIESLDTNKCLTYVKNLNYYIANKDLPTGISYEKYKYGENKNYETMDSLKSIDMKLKVDYLKEFDDRYENVEHKDSNVKPEITREEREYIAELLREKNEIEKVDIKEEDENSSDNVSETGITNNLNETLDIQVEEEKIKDETSTSKEERDTKDEILKTEDEINEKIKQINEMQEKITNMINKEQKRTSHALYDQIKGLK